MNTIEIHERLAAVVRAAIESTLDDLDSLHDDSKALPMMVEHLGTLLEIEKKMLVVESKETKDDCDHSIKKGDVVQTAGWQMSELHVVDVNHALRAAAVRLGPTGAIVVWPLAGMVKVTEKPWCPDDSGQWVESHGVDPELSDRLTVQALSKHERGRKKHIPTRFAPSSLAWPDIVAYKVVPA